MVPRTKNNTHSFLLNTIQYEKGSGVTLLFREEYSGNDVWIVDTGCMTTIIDESYCRENGLPIFPIGLETAIGGKYRTLSQTKFFILHRLYTLMVTDLSDLQHWKEIRIIGILGTDILTDLKACIFLKKQPVLTLNY